MDHTTIYIIIITRAGILGKCIEINHNQKFQCGVLCMPGATVMKISNVYSSANKGYCIDQGLAIVIG